MSIRWEENVARMEYNRNAYKMLTQNSQKAVYFLLHNIYKFSSYLTGNTIHLGCVARNSGRYNTEAVYFLLHNIYKFSSYLTGSTIQLRCGTMNLTTRPQRRSTFFYITYINSVNSSQEAQYISVL
jgi:NADH:ubiquinone oxidoreductase subunit E